MINHRIVVLVVVLVVVVLVLESLLWECWLLIRRRIR